MQFLNMFRSESEIFMDAVEKEMRNYLLENRVEKGKIKIIREKNERSELYLVLPKEDTYFYVSACINKIDTIVIGYASYLMEGHPLVVKSRDYDRRELEIGLKSCLPYYGIFPSSLHSKFVETQLNRLLKIISDTKRQKTTPSTI